MFANSVAIGHACYIMVAERSVSPPVYGVETEYTCMLVLPNDVVHEIVGSCHSPDVKLGLFVEPTSRGSAAFSEDDINSALAEQGIA